MNPIQLIGTGESGTVLNLNKEALERISSETRHVTVVSVIGPYRNGKSYLLNRLMGNPNGFALGADVEAKTKGFWLWLGDFPNDPSRCLILLDIEGLGDVKKGNLSHDLKMFTLALLLSSIFIYNTIGKIDASALDGLHLATKIVDELMSSDAKSERKEFARHFPHFIWAVRDHHLKLNLNGKEVTANDYLEDCLQPIISPSDGHQSDNEKYNKLREAIREFFPLRECITFPPPVKDFEKMDHLENVNDNELYPPFKKAADDFFEFVFANAKPKQIKGSMLTGSAYGKMLEDFLLSVEKKQLSINSTYDMVADTQNTKAFQSALERFNEIIGKIKLPLSTFVLALVATEAIKEANNLFLENCYDIENNKALRDNLREQMKEKQNQLENDNILASRTKCRNKLDELFAPIENQMKENYLVEGGFDVLNHDVNEVKISYETQVKNEEFGPCSNEVMQAFEREKVKDSKQYC